MKTFIAGFLIALLLVYIGLTQKHHLPTGVQETISVYLYAADLGKQCDRLVESEYGMQAAHHEDRGVLKGKRMFSYNSRLFGVDIPWLCVHDGMAPSLVNPIEASTLLKVLD